MKKIIFLLCFSLAAFSVNAQKTGFKIAYFDMDSLMAIMPDVKIAEDSAQSFLAVLEEKALEMTTELQHKQEEFEKLVETDGNLVAKKALSDEIALLQQRISEFQQAAQEEYAKFQDELLAPVTAKINKAAKKIATEKGYAFVLDSSKSAATVIYANESYNIFNEMCKELGIVKK